jgi:hypothetical protein
MIIICGKTIAEVERDLEMAKRAIATGAPMGIGGATIADVEQAMRGLRSAMGESNPPIDNPNYTAPCGRCCDCDCDPAYDDECEDCECGCAEDEEDDPCEDECEDGLSEADIDRIIETLGVPKALYDLVRQELGLL